MTAAKNAWGEELNVKGRGEGIERNDRCRTTVRKERHAGTERELNAWYREKGQLQGNRTKCTERKKQLNGRPEEGFDSN